MSKKESELNDKVLSWNGRRKTIMDLEKEIRLRGKGLNVFMNGQCPDCKHPIEQFEHDEESDYGHYCHRIKYKCTNCGEIYEEVFFDHREELGHYIETKNARILDFEIEIGFPWGYRDVLSSDKCPDCEHTIEQYEHDEKSDGGCHCDRSKYKCLNCGGIYEEYYSNERGEVFRYSFGKACDGE